MSRPPTKRAEPEDHAEALVVGTGKVFHATSTCDLIRMGRENNDRLGHKQHGLRYMTVKQAREGAGEGHRRRACAGCW